MKKYLDMSTAMEGIKEEQTNILLCESLSSSEVLGKRLLEHHHMKLEKKKKDKKNIKTMQAQNSI